MAKKKKYNIVPFQLCPKCGGTGTVTSINVSSTAYKSIETCDVCFGAKVIPQALIPINK